MKAKFFTITILVVVALSAAGAYLWQAASPSTGAGVTLAPDYSDTGESTISIVEVSERTLDNKPALALVFSTPLSPQTHYDDFISLTTDSGQAAPQGRWVLSDNRRMLFFPHIVPETIYTIRVRAGLPAANHSMLDNASEHKITTRKISPDYGFARLGSILAAQREALSVITVNVPAVDIQFLRVKEDSLPLFISRFYNDQPGGGHRHLNLSSMTAFSDTVYAARFSTETAPDTRGMTRIRVKDIDELKAPGLYIAVMSRPGELNYNEKVTFFVTSDIGIHTRLYKDRMDVYASSLQSGEGMSDVSLDLYDRQGNPVEKAATNAEGYASFKTRPAVQHSLVARHGGHITVLAFNEPALYLSGFDTNGAAQRAREIYVYSSRDLYRPGETADISILLRDHDGRTVEAQPLSAILRRPDGLEVEKFTLQPQQLGYYNRLVDIPANAQTGKWSLEVRIDPTHPPATQIFHFRVEEFLPERMALTLASEQETYLFNENIDINAEGAYLYGAPAAGNKFTATMNLRPAPHPVASLEDFFFGDVSEQPEYGRREIVTAPLDKDGIYRLSIQPLQKRLNSPMEVAVTASIFETSGLPVTRSIHRHIWPAEALIGIRPTFAGEFAEADSMPTFELVKAAPDGSLLGVRDVSVKIFREERNYYWTYDESQGWRHEFNETDYPLVARSLDIPPGIKTQLAVLVEHGTYRIELTDPDTQLVTRYRFHAGSSRNGWHRASGTRPDKVNLTLDKPAYRPGDNAVVQVVPPHAGRGIIMVESDRLLWSQHVELPAEGATVKIPIADEWVNRHDVYISAIVFRPESLQDQAPTVRAIGLVHLPMDRNDKKLTVELNAPQQIVPNALLPVRIRLPKLKNQQAIVTVSAVDVEILNITDFKTPDPYGRFFEKRRFAVDSYDVYGKIIETRADVGAKADFADDAESLNLNELPDSRGKTVALFSGPVQVNSNGDAFVELAVPDFNGRLRVMAVAFTEDSFGAAEQETTVAAPLIAEISTPPFLNAGDQTHLTLELHNLSGRDELLRVILKASAPLTMHDFDHQFDLADQAKTSFEFDLGAQNAAGTGQITLRIEGQGVNFSRTWELGVKVPYPREHIQVQKKLGRKDKLSANAKVLQGLTDDTVEAYLTVSTIPPLNLRDAAQGLLRYPYGSLEQTTSSAFPLVLIDEEKAIRVGLRPVGLGERSKRLETAFQQLRSMQLSNGGFGLWNNTSHEEIWLTSYVADFLIEARSQLFSIPDETLQKALENLHERLQEGAASIPQTYYTESEKHLDFAAKAYAAYVLAKVQQAPLDTLRTLYDHHQNDAESGLPLVHLGLALQIQGDDQRGMEAITKGLNTPRNPDKYLGDYGSNIRDAALIIALLERHGIETEGQSDLLDKLAKALGQRKHLSTQERLAVFLAANTLIGQDEQEWKGKLTVGKQESNLKHQGRLDRPITLKELQESIAFTPVGNTPLYANLEITGYSKEAPKTEKDKIDITRTLYDIQGRAIKNRPLKIGELAIVHLSLVSKEQLEHALVVDLLPAGLEAENLHLTRSETLKDLRIGEISPVQAMLNSNIKHQEYRDDRFVAAVRLDKGQNGNLFYLVRAVTPGEYTVPPPFAEDMYRPEIRGIGATPGKIKVADQ